VTIGVSADDNATPPVAMAVVISASLAPFFSKARYGLTYYYRYT
jgi:hypothetical protein